MEERGEFDAADKPTGRILEPGRVTSVVVRGKDNVELAALKAATIRAVQRFEAKYGIAQMWVQTWRERNATFLGAVENEKLLVTILFAIVSIVAFTMIAVVFYMIVLDKTRDIGTLRGHRSLARRDRGRLPRLRAGHRPGRFVAGAGRGGGGGAQHQRNPELPGADDRL